MTLEMRRGFKPNHRSFGEFMMSEQARKPALEVAEKVKEAAAGAAPRGKHEGEHMADKFQLEHDVVTIKGNPRATVKVFNDDPAAAPNEFGGPRNRKHRMLGRAGAQFGEFRGKE